MLVSDGVCDGVMAMQARSMSTILGIAGDSVTGTSIAGTGGSTGRQPPGAGAEAAAEAAAAAAAAAAPADGY